MDEADLELRNLTYRLFVELGGAPTLAEVAAEGRTRIEYVRDGWRRLHDAHALVLNPATPEIRMVNPFSAVPTAYRVHAASRWWYANCAWDALGIGGALGVDAHIETSCPDCGEPITIDAHGEDVASEPLLFHCLVPAAQWWSDIIFT